VPKYAIDLPGPSPRSGKGTERTMNVSRNPADARQVRMRDKSELVAGTGVTVRLATDGLRLIQVERQADAERVMAPRGFSGYVAEMKSLVQQRLMLNRDRMASIVTSIFGGIFMLLGIAQLTIGGNLILSWFQFGLGFVALVFGIVTGVRVRRRIQSFEREHGATAGKQ
jgi:hypothetical protein